MLSALLTKKIVLESFYHLNRGDVRLFLSRWDDEATLYYPGNMKSSGDFKGKKTIEQWFRTFFEVFPKRKFSVKSVGIENVFDFSGTNVITIVWEVVMFNHKGEEFSNSGVTVVHSVNGKAKSVRDFYYDVDALREAWEGESGDEDLWAS